MQILNRDLLDLEGKNLSGVDGKPATICSVSIEALLATYKNEVSLSGEDKLKRWELAVKLRSVTDTVELTVEEVALIKNLVGKAYGPVIVGQTWKVLEGEK